MSTSLKANQIIQTINEQTKLGDLRKIAKEIKKDHELALELWQNGSFFARMLSLLIMDPKKISETLIQKFTKDIRSHADHEQNQLSDWLMANQIMKDKKLISLIDTWENDPSSTLRRIYWYHQARLRWVGQKPPDNTEYLLNSIEKNIMDEAPEVQWAMNFTAGWIGVFDKSFRTRCIALGEKTGLYKGQMVSKGCTPDYLPEFIAIECKKRE